MVLLQVAPAQMPAAQPLSTQTLVPGIKSPTLLAQVVVLQVRVAQELSIAIQVEVKLFQP